MFSLKCTIEKAWSPTVKKYQSLPSKTYRIIDGLSQMLKISIQVGTLETSDVGEEVSRGRGSIDEAKARQSENHVNVLN